MNLATIVDSAPDAATALVAGDDAVSYGELRGRAAALRGALVRRGLAPGDRVALVLPNEPAFVAAYLAVLGAGGVAVPLNPAAPAPELESQLAAVQPTALIAGPTAAAALGTVLAGAGKGGRGALSTVVTTGGADLPGAEALDDLYGEDPAPLVERADDDLAVLMFTAGTAGAPKAAMLTHGNLRSNLEQTQRHPGRAVHPDDVILGVLPLFHVFGLNVALGLALYAGAAIVLVDRFDAAGTLAVVRAHGVTLIAGVPAMFHAWATLDGGGHDALSGVRLVVSGAAPLPPEVASAFEQRFGVPLHQGYGLTEASPTVTSSVVGQPPHPRSVGVPLPGVEVRLVDEDAEDAFVGDHGEIWVRGPNVFPGYWRDEAATAAALTPDGWLRTGDVAVVDDEGALYIVDRAKDLVIVSGFNVFPAEVEAALAASPDVGEVAVVGEPNARTGESVTAFVVPRPGRAPDPDALIGFCAGRIARYKCPSRVVLVDELPRGLAGKVLRRALR